MKKIYRQIGLVICFIILLPILVMSMLRQFIPDFLSLLVGLVTGWAIRETLLPITENDE